MVTSLAEIEAYLDRIRIPLRLACATGSGWPVVVSLWFLYQDGRLYCATQRSAKVISYIQQDSRCGFEIAEEHPPYCGVRGQAIASINENIGAEILKQLLKRYLGGTDSHLAKTLLAKHETEVAIVLDPTRIYTWNYSKRMQDMIQPSNVQDKVCP